MAEPPLLLYQNKTAGAKRQQPQQILGHQHRPVRAMGLKLRLLGRIRALILERQRQPRQLQSKRVVVLVACLASARYCNILYIYIYIYQASLVFVG